MDRNRIFVSGVSMGGYGTWFLMMMFPGRFAAALPVSGSRDMVEALRILGGNVQYTELAGVKHESWIAAYQNAKLVEWLFEQRRNR